MYIYTSSSPSVLLSVISLVRLDLAFLSLSKVYFPLSLFRKKKSRNYLKNERVGLNEILQHFTCPGWKNASLLRESSHEPSNKTGEQGQSRGSCIESEDAERWGCASPKEIKEQLARAKSEFGRNLDSSFPYLFAPIAALSFLRILTFALSLLPDLYASLFPFSIFLLFHG